MLEFARNQSMEVYRSNDDEKNRSDDQFIRYTPVCSFCKLRDGCKFRFMNNAEHSRLFNRDTIAIIATQVSRLEAGNVNMLYLFQKQRNVNMKRKQTRRNTLQAVLRRAQVRQENIKKRIMQFLVSMKMSPALSKCRLTIYP